MRQIVLDTETTGLDPAAGHRLIEIGCIELENRRITGRHFHHYINPERVVEQEAINIHGITNEFLNDKPVFSAIAEAFIRFVSGAELIIHNAAFDIGFLNHELQRDGNRFGLMTEHCTVIDTLAMARQKHPGQRNSLDALCKRYAVDNSHRELHGALLDAEILADIYLIMTGGQVSLALAAQDADRQTSSSDESRIKRLPASRQKGSVIQASEAELTAHQQRLTAIQKASNGKCVWLLAE